MIREKAFEEYFTKFRFISKFGDLFREQHELKFKAPIKFSEDELDQLQKTWNLYRNKQKEEKLPASLQDVIDMTNGFLVLL